MQHSDYIAYFRTIATRQPDLAHRDDECHFVRVIYSDWPSPHLQLDEFISKHKSGLHYPFMLCETWTKRMIGYTSDNLSHAYKGSFFIGDQLCDRGDFDALDALFDKTDKISEDIIAYMLGEFEDHLNSDYFPKRYLIEDSIELEHIGPFNGDKYGTRVGFQYKMSTSRRGSHQNNWL